MSNIKEFSSLVEEVRTLKPLVHHLTNYVTVNDCANITLAIGASPIMADAIEEAAEIAGIASSLVLNIGTLNARTVESMLAAGKSANKEGVPVIFDPVGAGASTFRNDVTDRIIKEIKISAIRGNISEIKYVSGLASNTKGVDASTDDEEDAVKIASDLAEKLDCVIAITGEVDTVSDGERTLLLRYGNEQMANITGTGCMCTSMVGAFCGTFPEKIFEATAAAILCMGIAGELAFEKSGADGNGSFHEALIDVVSIMDAKLMDAHAAKK